MGKVVSLGAKPSGSSLRRLGLDSSGARFDMG